MRKVHLVKVHFDRRSVKATDAWLLRRFEFFRSWTLPSILNQTFRDFRLWFHFDPDMEQVAQALRVIVPEGSLFTFMPYGHTPLDQLDTRSMLLGDDERFQVADWVYVTRIDSDDLWANDVMALVDACQPKFPVQSYPGGIEAAIFKRGYIHDVRTKVTRMFRNDSTPFHTLMIPKAVFIDPAEYARQFVGDHSMVNRTYPTQDLPPWRFCVLVHGDNFLSDMDYSSAGNEPVEAYWQRHDDPTLTFMDRPTVFDLDDFCDRHAPTTLACLDALKARYPHFRATLFTIPGQTSAGCIEEALKRDWLQLAVHGAHHVPNEELRELQPSVLLSLLLSLRAYNDDQYVPGFRPPGWYITREHVEACSQAGYWVALHQRDERALGPLCTSGYFVSDSSVNARQDCWHGHCHDTCGNGIEQTIKQLLVRWPSQQRFLFVQDAVLMPQK